MNCLQEIFKRYRSYFGKPTIFFVAILTFLISGWSAPEAMAAKPAEKEFIIVLDAGHGGHDHGAIDNGAREKDINLGVTTKLAELIKKKLKNVKVVLTRGDDRFVSLQDRANIANRNRGNLFVSIHTNSVDKSNPNRANVAGASVYALGSQKNADNLKVAQRENAVIELERDYHQKYSGFDPSKDESYIIFEMAQKKTIGQSLKFADAAQKQLVKSGRADRGVRQAGFWVLWATTMPSVLVELDFICNPESANYLNSKKGQDEMAEALFKAVEQYVDTQRKMQKNVSANVDNMSTGVTDGLTQEKDNSDIADNFDGKSTAVGSLVSANTEKKERVHNPATPQNSRYSSGPRRRRSASSREASAKRVLETDNILVKSETDYLLIAEKQKEEVSEPVAPADENKKDKKGKKNKKKKEKTSKDNNKKQNLADKSASKDKSGNKSNSNQKTFVVKSSGNNTASSNNPYEFYPSPVKSSKKDGKNSKDNKNNHQSKETKSGSSKAQTSSPATMTFGSQTKAPAKKPASQAKRLYKILLLSSDTELKSNDPKFQGITPSGMFVENGQYKYTFGGSESRSEIESQLMGIRSILPEATIVVRME